MTSSPPEPPHPSPSLLTPHSTSVLRGTVVGRCVCCAPSVVVPWGGVVCSVKSASSLKTFVMIRLEMLPAGHEPRVAPVQAPWGSDLATVAYTPRKICWILDHQHQPMGRWLMGLIASKRRGSQRQLWSELFPSCHSWRVRSAYKGYWHHNDNVHKIMTRINAPRIKNFLVLTCAIQ